jgi:hypothetical protein
MSSRIPLAILIDLRRPELLIAFCTAATTFAAMAMPEAAVNEDNLSPARKNQVRRTRQVSSMKTKPIPLPVRNASDNEFRLGMLAPDSAHIPRPLCSG